MKKTNRWCKAGWISSLGLVFSLSWAASAHAEIVLPGLDVETLDSDFGMVINSGVLAMDGTAIGFTLDGGVSQSIEPVDFALSALWSSGDAQTSSFTAGTIEVGDLLTAEFDSLTLTSANGFGQFSADLFYTAGLAAQDVENGRIEGTFFFGSGDISSYFSASDIVAAIGPVAAVPLPGAVWLLGSALAGLVGAQTLRRRVWV